MNAPVSTGSSSRADLFPLSNQLPRRSGVAKRGVDSALPAKAPLDKAPLDKAPLDRDRQFPSVLSQFDESGRGTEAEPVRDSRVWTRREGRPYLVRRDQIQRDEPRNVRNNGTRNGDVPKTADSLQQDSLQEGDATDAASYGWSGHLHSRPRLTKSKDSPIAPDAESDSDGERHVAGYAPAPAERIAQALIRSMLQHTTHPGGTEGRGIVDAPLPETLRDVSTDTTYDTTYFDVPGRLTGRAGGTGRAVAGSTDALRGSTARGAIGGLLTGWAAGEGLWPDRGLSQRLAQGLDQAPGQVSQQALDGSAGDSEAGASLGQASEEMLASSLAGSIEGFDEPPMETAKENGSPDSRPADGEFASGEAEGFGKGRFFNDLAVTSQGDMAEAQLPALKGRQDGGLDIIAPDTTPDPTAPAGDTAANQAPNATLNNAATAAGAEALAPDPRAALTAVPAPDFSNAAAAAATGGSNHSTGGNAYGSSGNLESRLGGGSGRKGREHTVQGGQTGDLAPRRTSPDGQTSAERNRTPLAFEMRLREAASPGGQTDQRQTDSRQTDPRKTDRQTELGQTELVKTRERVSGPSGGAGAGSILTGRLQQGAASSGSERAVRAPEGLAGGGPIPDFTQGAVAGGEAGLASSRSALSSALGAVAAPLAAGTASASEAASPSNHASVSSAATEGSPGPGAGEPDLGQSDSSQQGPRQQRQPQELAPDSESSERTEPTALRADRAASGVAGIGNDLEQSESMSPDGGTVKSSLSEMRTAATSMASAARPTVGEPRAGAANTADSAAALRAAEAVPLPEAAPRTAGPQQLSVRVATGENQTVDVRVAQRAGQVQVDVRSTDANLRTTLQENLSTLVHSMEQQGFHAEALTPRETGRAAEVLTSLNTGLGSPRDLVTSQASFSGGSSSGSSSEGETGSESGGGQQNQQQQQAQQERQPPRNRNLERWAKAMEQLQ